MYYLKHYPGIEFLMHREREVPLGVLFDNESWRKYGTDEDDYPLYDLCKSLPVKIEDISEAEVAMILMGV